MRLVTLAVWAALAGSVTYWVLQWPQAGAAREGMVTPLAGAHEQIVAPAAASLNRALGAAAVGPDRVSAPAWSSRLSLVGVVRAGSLPDAPGFQPRPGATHPVVGLAEMIHEFRRALDARGLATATVKDAIRNVRIVFNWGERSELLAVNKWHLFELMVVKLTRFANSGLTHQDSIHDLAVYAAMVESLVRKENKQ